jgi:hypothetical protein
MAKICLCVLMNHPYPQVLPLLRRIYAGRFSDVRFLVPFHRSDDPDVITVYRGSYTHSGYLADAAHVLREIDCDHYLVVHDDVLLNPQLSDESFDNLFPIGKDGGFIATADPTAPYPLQSAWVIGHTLRQLFPKSMLFGSGVEEQNITRFLPDAERLRDGFRRAGISGTQDLSFPADLTAAHGGLGSVPSRLMLHGLSQWLPEDARQDAVDAESQAALDALVRAALGSVTVPVREGEDGNLMVSMAFPTVTSHYFTDMYIVPKSGFADFAHYAGICAAANLFVEIAAPTMLFACCERVWTAPDLGLDFSGFDVHRPLSYFENARNLAIHPFKLSAFRAEAKADALVSDLRAIGRTGVAPRDSILARAGFGRWQTGFVGEGEGWHDQEGWGLWSAAPRARIAITRATPGPLRLTFQCLANVAMTGRLVLPAGDPIILSPAAGTGQFAIDIAHFDAGETGQAVILLENDALFRPCDLDPGSTDTRALGFGLARIEGADL